MTLTNLSNVLTLFNSHLLSRILGAGLVFILFYKDIDLLAEYSVLFSITHLLALIFKLGFSQKVYRETVADQILGLLFIKKYNTNFYIIVFMVSVYTFLVEMNFILIASILIAFSSVRCAYLTGCGLIKTAIFVEYSLPLITITFLLIVYVLDDIALAILLGYVPSFIYLLFYTVRLEKFHILPNTLSDYLSSFYFLTSGFTQQLNSHFAILFFGNNFSSEIVSAVRITQVLATPLQLVNVSFATNFQKIAQGDPFHENRKYERQYISISLLSTLIMNIAAILILPYLLDASKPMSLIAVFFGCFSVVYVLRVLLKFSDTRLIIKRQESLIFFFNSVISLICITGGYMFAMRAMPIPSYVMFNLGSLLLGLFSLINIRFHRSNV